MVEGRWRMDTPGESAAVNQLTVPRSVFPLRSPGTAQHRACSLVSDKEREQGNKGNRGEQGNAGEQSTTTLRCALHERSVQGASSFPGEERTSGECGGTQELGQANRSQCTRNEKGGRTRKPAPWGKRVQKRSWSALRVAAAASASVVPKYAMVDAMLAWPSDCLTNARLTLPLTR